MRQILAANYDASPDWVISYVTYDVMHSQVKTISIYKFQPPIFQSSCKGAAIKEILQ